MNSYYKNAVALFGLVLPVLGLGLLAAACLYGVSNMQKKFTQKNIAYAKAQGEERKVAELQGRVARNGNHLRNWQKVLSKETRGTFIEHWKSAEQKFSGQELSRAPHHWINYNEGLGKGVKQPASQVEMKFTGTFRAMQLALMEIESKLPQLQLDALTVTPDDDAGKLNFKTKFTVWTQN